MEICSEGMASKPCLLYIFTEAHTHTHTKSGDACKQECLIQMHEVPSGLGLKHTNKCQSKSNASK